MNLFEYIKNNKIFRKYQPGGTMIDISKPFMSREAYLNQERQKVIDAAYQNSLAAQEPYVPLIKEEYRHRPMSENEKWLWWNWKQKHNVNTDLVPGSSCLWNFTGWFGDKYQIASNYKFRHMSDMERGFTRVDPSEIQKGDGVFVLPSHTMMFDSFDDSELPLFNHSNGGFTADSLKRQVGYKPGNELMWDGTEVYRFVGNQEDNDRWNAEYLEQRKAYDRAVNEYLRSVPILNLPQAQVEAPQITLKMPK